MSDSLTITRWPGGYARTQGVRRRVSRSVLTAWLALSWPAHSDAHPGWSPATFRGDSRDRDTMVQSVEALGLDVDEGVESVEQALAPWRSLAGVWHTTRRSTAEAPRLRVVLWLSRPVDELEHARLVRWARQQAHDLGGYELCPSAKNASRFWFCPCAGSELGLLEGAELDVDAVLSIVADEPEPVRRAQVDRSPVAPGQGRPGDDFLARGSLAKIIEPHGWRRAGRTGDQDAWTRPGKERGISATWNGRYFYCHTNAAQPLESQHSYDLLGLYAELEHGGDMRSAVRDLAGQGYGEQRPARHEAREGGAVVDLPSVDDCPSCEDVPEAFFDESVADALGEVAADVQAIAERVQAAKAEAKPWTTPANRCRKLASEAVVLMPTGVASLDKATRGGLRPGKRVCLQSPPGVGKTTWGVGLGVHYAARGHHVAIIAADEEADGLLIRIGQIHGLSRDDLDRRVPAAWEKLAEYMDGLPSLHLLDGDEFTIENVSKRLAEIRNEDDPTTPSVLIDDSLQTSQSSTSGSTDTPRARVDAVLGAVKRASRTDGHLVIDTCEMSRGAYRSKDAGSRIDDLAAGKESGGIEYAHDLMLVLRSVEGETGMVDVTMPKNRMGVKATFRLRQDFDRATFTEAGMPDHDEDVDASEDALTDRAKQRILRVLRRHTNLRTRDDVVKRAGGRRSYNQAALSELMEDGSIVKVDKCFRSTVQPTVHEVQQ